MVSRYMQTRVAFVKNVVCAIDCVVDSHQAPNVFTVYVVLWAVFDVCTCWTVRAEHHDDSDAHLDRDTDASGHKHKFLSEVHWQ